MARTNKKPGVTPPSAEARHLRFAREYVIDWNGTQAAIRAGYSEHSAGQQAARLLKDARVQEAIRARKAELDAEYEHRVMGKFEVLSELTRIARGDIGDLKLGSPDWLDKAKEAGQSHLIKKVKEITTINSETDTETHTTEVEMYSRHEALRDLGKHHQLFTEKVDVTSGGQPISIKLVFEGKQDAKQD